MTPNGPVHKAPADLRKAIASDPKVRKLWEDTTPSADHRKRPGIAQRNGATC